MTETHLFVGPSAHGLALPPSTLDGLTIHPPIKRHDLPRLLRSRPEPGVVIVCDGVFKSHAAVSHAELCAAIDAGWEIHGVSSIGAIRAHEMRLEGMHGHGEVFAMYSRLPDLTDDEACLLHFPESPWFPISEALVNVRWALSSVGDAYGISSDAATGLVRTLQDLWFGDRTESCIRDTLSRLGVARGQIESFLAWTRQNRIKTLDLAQLLVTRPWLRRRVGQPTPS